MKIGPGKASVARHGGRTEPVILFVVANRTFAISARSVHEIRSTDSLSGSATQIHHEKVPKVRQQLRRGSQSVYIVDACEHFGLPPSRATLVLLLRSSRVAVLADRIERMDAISLLLSLPRPFRGPERAWYRGVTLIGEEVVPVVSSTGFLTEREINFLDGASTDAGSSAAGASSAENATHEEDSAGAES